MASPTAVSSAPPRPRDDELDLFGLTHRGHVRAANEDQFLLCTVNPQVVVHGTSLDTDALALRGERLATIMLVADGVGGSADGTEASKVATRAVMAYFASAVRCWQTAGAADEAAFATALREAALEAHTSVLAESAAQFEGRRLATTLCVAIVVWPHLYVVQVGDSRCYHWHEGTLRQLTRDQTIAQEMIDRGVLTPERAVHSPLQHVLSSAIGAEEALPEVTHCEIAARGAVTLVCSDGLTRHVSDAEIGEACAHMESAEQLCRSLLAMALERGGRDNITIVAGRARP